MTRDHSFLAIIIIRLVNLFMSDFVILLVLFEV